MKKRILCALLGLGLCLGPVQAAESGFQDVKEGDWFAPYVSVCVENGLMKGTGDGNFSPSAVLTQAECSALALRLFMLPRGGDGSFEAAPEELGRMVLTLADGTEITGYQGDDSPFWTWSYQGALSRHIQPPGETLEEQVAWCQAHEGPATLAAAGQVWQGQTALYYTPAGHGNQVVLDFTPNPEDREAMSQVIQAGLLYEGVPGPDKWWRDAAYTAQQWEVEGLAFSADNADRAFFVRTLSAVTEKMEAINAITSLPDTEDADVLAFYNAGITTGVDATGTFAGDRTLTRSEAAAMVARVAEPSLRQTFVPQTAPTQETPAGGTDTGLNDKVALTVNGQEMTAGELAAWLVQVAYYWDSYYYSNFNSRLTWNEEIEKIILEQAKNQAVAYVLMSEKAAELGCSLQGLAAALTPSPTREELAAYVAQEGLLRAKHILVADEASAQSIIDSLNVQPTQAQFDNILALLGTDPGMTSNPNGYLFTSGEMVEEFEKGVLALEVGAYSPQPVQSSFGYHVILRLDPLDHPDLPAMYQEDRMNDWVDQRIAQAAVQVNEAVIGQIDIQSTYELYLQSLSQS